MASFVSSHRQRVKRVDAQVGVRHDPARRVKRISRFVFVARVVFRRKVSSLDDRLVFVDERLGDVRQARRRQRLQGHAVRVRAHGLHQRVHHAVVQRPPAPRAQTPGHVTHGTPVLMNRDARDLLVVAEEPRRVFERRAALRHGGEDEDDLRRLHRAEPSLHLAEFRRSSPRRGPRALQVPPHPHRRAVKLPLQRRDPPPQVLDALPLPRQRGPPSPAAAAAAGSARAALVAEELRPSARGPPHRLGPVRGDVLAVRGDVRVHRSSLRRLEAKELLDGEQRLRRRGSPDGLREPRGVDVELLTEMRRRRAGEDDELIPRGLGEEELRDPPYEREDARGVRDDERGEGLGVEHRRLELPRDGADVALAHEHAQGELPEVDHEHARVPAQLPARLRDAKLVEVVDRDPAVGFGAPDQGLDALVRHPHDDGGGVRVGGAHELPTLEPVPEARDERLALGGSVQARMHEPVLLREPLREADQKHAQEERRAGQGAVRDLLERLGVGLGIVDGDARVHRVSAPLQDARQKSLARLPGVRVGALEELQRERKQRRGEDVRARAPHV